MREIRFRAWDKRSQFMFYNVQNGITFDDGSHYKFSDFLEDTDRWEVMQYTGLKDKNGTEIYEGDVVISISSYEGKHVSYSIIYYKNGFYLNDFLYSDWDAQHVEVLGNIYEHNHLLDNNDQND